MRVRFTKVKHLTTFALMMLFSFGTFSQSQGPLDIALRHLEEKKTQWQLTDADIADLVVSDHYVSTPSQATMMYFNQKHEGVKVFNAIFNVAISKEGKVVYSGNRIIADIAGKANASSPALTPELAMESALTNLGVPLTTPFVLKERKNDQEFVFEKGNYSKSDISVDLQYFPYKENEVRLVWAVSIELTDKNDAWNMKVDAATGEILDQFTLIVKCTFENDPYHNHNAECRSLDNIKIIKSKKEGTIAEALAMPTVQGGSYNVYAEIDGDGNVHPHESPSHGDRNLLTNLEDATASPFGWHDTDGMIGEDYTITRGNNVHAYLDLNNDNVSQNDEPDGGAGLSFDFPIDTNNEPDSYEAAAITNAFFMVNFMHDLTYAYGFDEAAGNYQTNNYGNGGAQGDFVEVQVHDGGGTNNANFNVVADGANGRMQMYLWNAGTVGLLTVNEPITIAGIYDAQYAYAVDTWGGQITMDPLTAEVAIVDDGTPEGTMGCEVLVNEAEVTGKIAIVDRGLCEFGEKAFNAQNAGAVGVIICNYEDALPPLGGGAFGAQVTIPVIGISSGDCATIRGFAGNGLNISFVEPSNSGPEFVSGALDNGIIAHEFGHGISLRLVGGPNNAFCLGNGEQMGEGISDFFTLVTTVKPGDSGEMIRGIGTYAQRQDIDGRGIRRYPYSTDMTINPLTYKDIVGQGQHARGEIWTLALWEMYWLLVDAHGFDPDLLHGTGGNNIAIQLAVEGMKLNPCGPGYIEARDAILASDELMYNGENQCLIWQAFAKRGMGEFAEQVSAGSTNDGFEDFTVPGLCTKDIQIAKTVTDIIDPGDVIDVTLDVVNFKDETTTNVVVTDEIPAGCTVVPGSATNGGTVNGNTIVFNLGDVASMQEIEITYQLNTDPNIYSVTQFLDDVENEGDTWDILIDDNGATNIWDIRDDSLANSGEKAWFIQAVSTESVQSLFTLDPISVTGTQPVLRFYHWYDTEYATDGGWIDISKDGVNYEQIGDDFFRNGYPRQFSYQTIAIPFLSAYSGESNLTNSPDFVASYLDLSNYLGEDIYIRFRFATNAENSGIGWFVDDIEVMDMANYEGQACLTSDDGDNVCAIGVPRGTIVNSEILDNTNDLFDPNMNINIFPNPAGDILNLHIQHDRVLDANISILSIDGKEFLSQPFQTTNGLETMTMNVANLPAGFYLVKVMTTEGIVVEKLTIK